MSEKIHWADVYAAAVRKGIAHRIATGITPSGPIHIGNMREVITGDLVYKAMRDSGSPAELLYIADDFDPLRKVYPFLPPEYEAYIGRPLCDIPCPCGQCANYAEHYLRPFLNALAELDVHPTVIRASKQYRNGAYTDEIRAVLENASVIRDILERISKRTLPADWSPYYPICARCGRIINVPVRDHDQERHTVRYTCPCGWEGESDYSRGEGKLVWRVDWPMRWAHFGVTVEPFGKDHAAAGGSYDTGKEIVARVFGAEAPHPVMYEWISLKGRGAMASSTGVAVTIDAMLEIVPPDVLRYLIARSKPEKAIDFDPGMGLLTLIDEFDRIAQSGDSREYELSRISSATDSIPFRHMVTVVQIATDIEGIFPVLERSGYDISDRVALAKQAERARIWLDRYAPDMVKFQVQETLPAEVFGFNEEEKIAIAAVLSALTALSAWDAEHLHNAVYMAGEETGINPKKIFTALYLALLGQKRGPRLGFFLEALGRTFVVNRLLETVNAGAE
ncbi:MAG: lysine--tRNA ligase [Methanomicrobiales archaeon]|nr:lysine--tRNA ligase [Methanomicrobiales archaeon]